MSKYNPISDLKVKTREYQDKDGKTKSVWQTVGTLWSTEHGSSQFITLDAIPVTSFKDGEKIPFDGRISVFRREEYNNANGDKPMTQSQALNGGKDIVLEDIDDNSIDLNSIPF